MLIFVDKNNTRSKKRGRTKLKAIWNDLSDGEKIFVEVDKYGQEAMEKTILDAVSVLK